MLTLREGTDDDKARARYCYGEEEVYMVVWLSETGCVRMDVLHSMVRARITMG